MARLPAAARDSVPESQGAAFDDVVRQRGVVPTTGPISVLLNAPELAQLALALVRYLRMETSLAPRIRELCMLVAARENDCRFIWNFHAPVAREAGLRPEIVDALRDNKQLPQLASDEEAVVNYGREFFRTHRVSQAAFDAALVQFGVLALTELTNLMGCYAMLAFNLNAFGVEIPADSAEEALPI